MDSTVELTQHKKESVNFKIDKKKLSKLKGNRVKKYNSMCEHCGTVSNNLILVQLESF